MATEQTVINPGFRWTGKIAFMALTLILPLVATVAFREGALALQRDWALRR